MANYRIIYDRDVCIGAAACEDIDPKRFKINSDDGKADLIKGKEDKSGLFILDVDDLGTSVEAAKACPVRAIMIKDLKNNEDVV